MIKMMKWEWMHMKKSWLVSLGLEAVWVIVISILYMVAKKSLFKVMKLLYGLPVNVYALLGLESNTETGNLLFFLLAYFALATAWNMWKACEGIVEGIHMDEKTNIVQLFCGQGFSRTELAVAKFGGAFGGFVIKAVVLGLLIFVCTLTFGGYIFGAGSAFVRIFGLVGKSVLVGGMFLAIAYLYAMCTDKNVSGKGNWLLSILFVGPWLIGNLYRIKNFILELLAMFSSENASVTEKLVLADGSIVEQVSTRTLAFDVSVPEGLEESLVWLDKLGHISPLSWLNPFREANDGVFAIKFIFCVVVIGGCVAGAIWCYRHKRSVC